MLLIVTSDAATMQALRDAAVPFTAAPTVQDADVAERVDPVLAGCVYAYGPDVLTDRHLLWQLDRRAVWGVTAGAPTSDVWSGAARLGVDAVIVLPEGGDFLRTAVATAATEADALAVRA